MRAILPALHVCELSHIYLSTFDSLLIHTCAPLRNSLTKRRKFCVLIALAAAASLAVGVWVSRAGSANMSAIVKTRSQLEPGVTNLAYKRGIDACSKIGASSQTASSFRSLLANPSGSRDFVTARLQQITAVNTIECACLIDKNMTVLVAAHAPDLHGTHYDPAGVVSSTLRTYKRHTRTAVIGIDEFKSLNPPLRYFYIIQFKYDRANNCVAVICDSTPLLLCSRVY
jgi:hypothetical protein